MLIEDHLNVVVVPDEVSVFVCGEVEVDSFPDFLHLFQPHLDVVLLWGSLTDLDAGLRMVHQVHLQHLTESERLGRTHLEAHLLRYLLPVPLSHTLLPQSYHQGHFRLELVQLSLHCLRNLQYRLNVPFLEEPHRAAQHSHTFLHELLGCRGIQTLPFSIRPLLNVLEPLVRCYPQVTVRCEFLYHLLDLSVIGVVHVEQGLPAVELSRIFLESLQWLVDFDAAFCHNFVVLDVLPCVEI